MPTTGESILLLQIIILAVGVWFSFRKLKPQILVDGSQAAVNFQNALVKIQEEQRIEQEKNALDKKLMQDEINSLKNIIEHADLEVRLKVKIGETPIITGYSWQKREDTIVPLSS